MKISTKVFTKTTNEFTIHVKINCPEVVVNVLEETIEQRSPVDIVCVVDRSGSMAGSRIRLVKDTIDFLLSNLQSTDRFSLVTYSDEIRVKFPLDYMNSDNISKVSRMSESMVASHQTYLSGGLYTGVEELLKKEDCKRAQAVLLMTDGHANIGDTDTNVICSKLKELLTRFRYPVSVHTFGYGDDHSEMLLSSIANIGNGMYYFINNIDKIGLAYADCLGGLISTIITRPVLTLKYPYMIEFIIHGCSNVERVDNQTLKINLHELQRDDCRDIIIDIKTQCSLDPKEIFIELSGNNIMNPQENLFPLNAEFGNDDDFQDYLSQNFRIIAFESMFNALDNRDRSIDILNDAKQQILKISPENSYAIRIIDEIDQFIILLKSGDSSVWKKIIQSAMAHKFQKSVGLEISSHSAYNTNSRKIMQSRYNNREKYARCHNCGQKGHFAKNCSTEEMCHNCKQKGHRASECPSSSLCHKCKQPGHMMRDCPVLDCFKCGQTGHMSKNCPNNRGRRGGGRGGRGGRGGGRGGRRKR